MSNIFLDLFLTMGYPVNERGDCVSFGSNLVSLRKSKNISRKELAEMLDIPYTTLRNYEADQREPGHKFLIKVANLFSVSVDELIGNALKNDTPSLSNEALQVAIDYSDLDMPDKRVVRVVMDDQTQRVREEAKKNTADFIYLPWNDQPASAGAGFDLDDEQMVEWKVILNELTRKADFCLDVQGDSMEPKYYDGDTILVRKQPAVDIGEIGLFIIDGKGYVKKQGADRLISLNPIFVDIYPNEYSYVRCAGKVLGTLLPEWIISR